MITKNKILNSLHEVFENSKNSELKFENFKSIQKDLKTIAAYLKINNLQVIYFSIITIRNFNGDHTRIKDICEHLGLPAIKILSEIDLIEGLLNKSYIKRSKSRRMFDDNLSNSSYYTDNKLNEAIIKGLPCPDYIKFNIESSLDLIEQINSIIDSTEEESVETDKVLYSIDLLYQKYPDLIFFKEINKYELQPLDKIILLKVIWKSILGQDGLQINTFLEGFIKNKRTFVKTVQSIYNKSNNLIKYDLLESKRGGFMDDVEYHPSNKLKEMLKDDNILLNDDKSSIKRDDIILPIDIITKALFYNEDIEKEIHQLQNLLVNDKYNELIEKLNKKNLPLNLNILLFGHPGTGKTETVMQLAKATNREVMKIDISSTKSKWFGDSEKIIKRIFDQYHTYSETCEYAPILLFNEADAILSKRNSNTNSSTNQTENAIQNILLEELENFKGIFIATTNLASNLDSAFERRFLFKLKFNKPELNQRISILENKIPGFRKDDYLEIANFHDFTGSEIENITRKIEISDILGEPINSIDSILQLCKNEIVNMKKKNNIGFIK
jgi:hypothetical protein